MLYNWNKGAGKPSSTRTAPPARRLAAYPFVAPVSGNWPPTPPAGNGSFFWGGRSFDYTEVGGPYLLLQWCSK